MVVYLFQMYIGYTSVEKRFKKPICDWDFLEGAIQSYPWPSQSQTHGHRSHIPMAIGVTYPWSSPSQSHTHGHRSHIPMAIGVTYPWSSPSQSHTHGHRSHIPMTITVTYPWLLQSHGHRHRNNHDHVVAINTVMGMWLRWVRPWSCGCNGYGHDHVVAVGTVMAMWLQWVRSWPCGCNGYGHGYVIAMIMGMWWRWICDSQKTKKRLFDG